VHVQNESILGALLFAIPIVILDTEITNNKLSSHWRQQKNPQ